MICPYCKNEMKKGWVDQDRYSLKWTPAEDRGLLEMLLQKNVIMLTSLAQGGRVVMYHCADCKKFIIDENEIEV